MTRTEALEMVAAAAAKIVDEYCLQGDGVPVFKEHALLPEGYWSPSARMLDAEPVMALREALAVLEVAEGAGWQPIETAPKAARTEMRWRKGDLQP